MVKPYLLTLFLGVLTTLSFARAQNSNPPQNPPWMNKSLSADERAKLVLAAMTPAEKNLLVFGYFSTDFPAKNFKRPEAGIANSAGYIPGIDRLRIPAQWETDAGVGVATQRTNKPRERTALPSGLATVATWNRDIAYAGGAMIGNEARLSGFNVQLAGGINLMRDPRNGRNFEYGGEDPLLAGVMVGNEIKGIQSNHIISTVKHFAFNNQETNRFTLDAQISDQAARTSDLLAFQIALEVGDPGAVMCAYNRVNGSYACESDWLLNQVLKKDWGFKGYVMSDWGATHSTIPAANAGLDQESGYPFDLSPYFTDALAEAVTNGHVKETRMDDMVFRILREMFARGIIDNPVKDLSESIDYKAHEKTTQADEEEAIVLLKNDRHILPLNTGLKKIAIIGGHADVGVLSGGGSSQVYPVGGLAVPNEGPAEFPGPMVYYPSSPMKAIASRITGKMSYNDGKDQDAAAKLAAESDVAIVFANQWTGESLDVDSLHLNGDQDALISKVAKSNKNTIVVIQTGGPVVMPWLADVSAVLEAWYPGTRGGEAIARVLTGEINPSGHLPVTFPLSEAQLPRPKLDGDAHQEGVRFTANYNIEGAAVGYKWFDLKHETPLFPFGYGLSYTSFAYSDLRFSQTDHGIVTISLKVKNTGETEGKAVPQIYVSRTSAGVNGGWEAPKRLAGWAKINLKPGDSTEVNIQVDPRLLCVFNSSTKKWKFTPGEYQFTVPTENGPSFLLKKHIANLKLAGNL